MKPNLDTRAQEAWRDHLAHWGPYAAATGAALALATGADAEIFYSAPLSLIVNASHSSVNFDLANGHNVAVHFVASRHSIEVQGSQTHFFAASVVGKKSVADFFGPGQLIGGSHTSSGQGADLRRAYGAATYATRASGHWGPGTVTGFLGCITSPAFRPLLASGKGGKQRRGLPGRGRDHRLCLQRDALCLYYDTVGGHARTRHGGFGLAGRRGGRVAGLAEAEGGLTHATHLLPHGGSEWTREPARSHDSD